LTVMFKYKMTIRELKENPQFLELCAKFKLSPDEAIECLKLNHRKIECVFSNGYRSKGELKGFRRREQ
jgi:hypothetical protein